ncbi:DUF3540 domain-containing protein [Xenorhabdus innexi]|uniref:DUF3540 domain-containing protein n=1 Tax=Xenorhabdus innexi TaxID=290109 RepID=A0A1N6MYG8_9GAMM|nr:DUF3540 domain-containing protein [Xenorhabdus innexi]PHM28784.1 hypothetical protein Xinn_03771 [Xenorhabdus innexi]SIP73862.1 conserved hypothetical protein [Xenorhabdus innexi]
MSKPSYALSSPPLTDEPTQQVAGQVIRSFPDGSFMVESHHRGWRCQRAVSCLLTPELGDTVLVTQVEGQHWLLAVLTRPEHQQQAEITVPGDLTLAPQGNLHFNSEELHIDADSGHCHIKKMHYTGESLSAWVTITQLIGNQFESVWQTITQLSHRLFRHTAQTEQVRAGQLDMQADSYLRLHAQNTLMSAKAVAKIDAEQIHVG